MKRNITLSLVVAMIVILSGLGFLLAEGTTLTDGSTDPITNKVYTQVSTPDLSSYIKQDFNSKYGAISLYTDKDGKITEYSLTDISESVINIKLNGKATLYKNTTLFDDANFYNEYGGLSNLKNGKFQVLLTKDNLVSVPTEYTNVCSEDKVNATPQKPVCQDIPSKYGLVNQPITQWEEYRDQVLSAGNYEWSYEGERSIGQKVDIVPVKNNMELTEWVWYNTTWQYKKLITITNQTAEGLNNYTIYLLANLTTPMAEGKMSPRCDDIRFLNSTETGELNFRQLTCTTGNNSVFEIRLTDTLIPGATTIYMYYGNTSTVTSTSNENNTYLFYDLGTTNRAANYYVKQIGGTPSITYNVANKYYNLTNTFSSGSGIMMAVPKDINMSNVSVSVNLADTGPTSYTSGIFLRANNPDNGYRIFKLNAAIVLRGNINANEVTLSTTGNQLVNKRYYLATAYALGSTLNYTWQNATYLGNNQTINSTYNNGSIGISNYYDSTTSFYNLTVRKYVGTIPTYTFGTEEVNTISYDSTYLSILYPLNSIYNYIITSLNFSLNSTTNLSLTLPYAYTSQGIIQIMPTKNNTAIYGCEGTLVNANSATNGNSNTAAIVAGCYDPMSAARYCSELTFNGYTDWYLPANDTLNEIIAQDLIDNITKGDYTGTWQSMYTEESTISSTEYNNNYYHTINGNPVSDNILYSKNSSGSSTRCVRDNTLSAACTIWNGTANNTVSCVNNVTTNLASNQGVNQWFLYYTNSSNYQWQANISFYVDSIIPQITMVVPVNKSVTNISNIVLNYTYIEANVSKIWWTNDSGVTNTSLLPFGTNISAIGAWNQGWNNVTVYINDTVGFENYTGVDFFVDSIYPLITMVNPTNGSIFQTNTPIKINFTVVDANLGVCYYNNGSTNQYLASCLDNITYTPTQGWNQIKVYINDTVNNVNQTNVTFFVDSIIPLISITSPLNGSLINTTTTTITYTATDTYLTNCFWSNGTTNHSTTCGANIVYINNYGYNTIWVYANDSASNLNTSKVTYLADPTAPNASMMTPTDNSYVNKTALNFSVNATDIVGLKNITIYLFNATGLYNQTNITIPGNPVSSMIGIVITMVDNVYTWFYQLYDMVGNGYTSATQTVTVDSLNPLITIVQPLNGTIFNDTNIIQINWTLSDSHLSNCFWSNGTTNQSIVCGNNVSYIANQGYNTIWAYANDSASNLNTSKVVFFVDNIIPLISIVNPTNGSAIGVDTSTLINYTVVDANLNNCWWNNGSVNHALPDCYTNITYTMVLGYQTITVYVNDTLGHVNSTSTILIGDRLNFDFVTPLTDINDTNKNISKITVQLTYSSPSGYNYSTIDLFNSTRNSVGRVMYNVSTNTNGICYQETSNNYTSCGGIGIGTYDNETAGVVNINYTKPGTALNSSLWTVKHGNTTQAIATNVSIPLDCWNTYADKLQLRMVSNAGGNVEYSYAQCYNGTTWRTLSNATSNSSAVHGASGATTIYAATDGDFATKVGYKVGNGWQSTITHSGLQSSAMIFEEAMVWNTTSTPNMTASFTNIPDGRYYFNATIINTLGLANATGTRQILIDTTMPVFNITQPLNNSIFNVTTVQINYTATDSNLGTCWYNNGSVNQYLTCGNNISYTGFQGYNNITIYVNDTTGNTMYQTITFLVDTINPMINMTYPTYDNKVLTGYGSVNITIYVSSNDTNLANTTIFVFNSTRNMIDNYTFYTPTYTYRYNPTSLGTYYYNASTIDLAGFKNTTDTREILFTDFNLTICNGTYTQTPNLYKVYQVFNVSFYDEENPTISIPAELYNFQSIYYMFDPLYTKTYLYQNATGNPSYTFCAYPMDSGTWATGYKFANGEYYHPINMSISFSYSHVNYTTRTYSDTLASYVVNNGTLALPMLLKTTAHTVTFQVYDLTSAPITNVDVEVFFVNGGTLSPVFVGKTDSSGIFATSLNGDKTYVINYSKAGYNVYTQTVQPVLTSYTVYMSPIATITGSGAGGAGTASGTGSFIPQNNISWTFSHTPNQWYFNYNTSVKVTFNVTTMDNSYGGSRIEVWTNSTNMLNYTAMNKTLVGNRTSLSLNQSIGSNIKLIVKYYIYNSSSITDYHLVYTEEFKVLNITSGPNSLDNGLNSWKNYVPSEGFEEAFSNAWWVFFILCILIAIFCYATGVELMNPMAIGLGFTMILGVLCSAKLLYIPGLYNEFINKYIIVIISGLFNIGYITSVWRERG